ncbi:retinol dehydrogenase 12-like isoform X2 [Apostichopus japonicus]|uniref:retinol dehydrogenase 12-like isoform X2 n=1 Tax=Stichopus japonicus TaxID=307972 RepID=UPI003AB5B958
MDSLTVGIITAIWKYSNLFFSILLPLIFWLLYKFSFFGYLLVYRYVIACSCLIAIIPCYFLWRWYIYYIRGGNHKSTSSKSMKGKTVIITGGNSGIGKGAAIHLARRGARVILACRNAQKAQEAITEITSCTGNQNIVFRKLDLLSFKSVREFADRILQEEERLDVLINNAGIPDTNTHDEDRTPFPSEDGYSQSFQVNHFSHFLLTNLLLDLLKKSSPSRVVNVTSRLNTAPTKLDFTVGDGNVRYPKLTHYTKGKLANVLFTKEFAKRMEGTGVTSYSVDPGIIFSNIWEKQITKWKVHAMSLIFWLLFCDELSGSENTVYCAVEEGLQSGLVYFDCRPSRHVNPLIKNDELREKLWNVSLEVTDLK